jgi:putative hydrolase of the HAD superfamily
VEDSITLREKVAASTGHDADRFTALWQETYRLRETGPLDRAFRALGVPDAEIEAHIEARYALTRRALVPRDGVLSTLAELHRRGFRLGLVSACTEEVPAVWPDTPFAGLFDAEVFSAVCGHMKPDPEIFLLAAEGLGVEPADCLYVGDGANDELAGAERVGMRSVLVGHPGKEPFWADARDWAGERIESIPEVLDLVSGSRSK